MLPSGDDVPLYAMHRMTTNDFSLHSTPAQVYQEHFARAQRETRRLYQRHMLLGFVRLAWVGVALLIGWYAYTHHSLSWWSLLFPLAGFAVTARFHDRVLDDYARSFRAEVHYEGGLARLDDRWIGLHPRATPVDINASLYAADLDLFTPGGLFELLCTARTQAGEETLAEWLLQPAPHPEVLARQAAIADLGPRNALREAIASVPGSDAVAVDRQALGAWANGTSTVPAVLRWIAPLLVVLTLAAAVVSIAMHSMLLLIPMLVINGALTYLLQRQHKDLFAETQGASRRLAVLTRIFAALEREHFNSPLLQAQQEVLLAGGGSASKALRRLATLSLGVEQRANFLVRVVEFLLLYSVQLGTLVEAWRRQHRDHVLAWLNALGNFEALLSFSAYHFEHPADAFPELVADELTYTAEGLGHPLLSPAACVPNDVHLGSDTRLLLISGSNMSGKSTLLRSIGVNAVLAMAGGPVRARRLRLAPVHLAASIQVQDSLQAGRSRFYAEILRLRSVRDAAVAHPPVLFLLDELLAGTNSHDRLVGAQGLVSALLASGAFGLLTTHDLALTDLPVESTAASGSTVRNMHFEDTIVDGELRFDYGLRPGVVERSNGLELMRMIGLDV